MIEIKANKWHAKIEPKSGGNIAALNYEGCSVYRPLNRENTLKGNPFLCGSPILFPANRTANGKFTFEGKVYKLPITEKSSGANLHGMLYKQNFIVKEHSNNGIELVYENYGEIYPFPFKIITEYYIKGNSFYQRYEIINIGKTNMPLTFALHTTFAEPEFFSVPISSAQERDIFNIPTGRYIPLTEAEKKYITKAESKDTEISGYYKSEGRTAQIGFFCYTVSENFDHWILFNGKGISKLLCVEPQCGKVNGLNEPNGYRILRPDENIVFSTELKHKQKF